MIANFYISDTKSHLISADLSSDKFYLVNFLNINIILKEENKNCKLFELETNLIERSGFNPMRTLTFFIIPIGHNFYSYLPPQKIYYKLSLSNLKSPIFVLREPSSGEIVPIRDISVQLELRETNGWF